jgi:hypothetical protein
MQLNSRLVNDRREKFLPLYKRSVVALRTAGWVPPSA